MIVFWVNNSHAQNTYHYTDNDLLCLTLNLHFESNLEPIIGKIAVAQVVLARVESPHHPNNICDVIQFGAGKEGCAFSWKCDDKPNNLSIVTKTERISWQENMRVAQYMLSDERPIITDIIGATLYHNLSEGYPWWAKADGVTFLAKVYNHLFYREDR